MNAIASYIFSPRRFLCFRRFWLCALPLLLGCGDGTCPVAGTVIYNGQPVAQGEISFVSEAANVPPDGCAIENGKFALRTKPGARIVQVRGSRPLPADQQPTDGSGLLYEDFIPARHHRESSLKVEIPAEGSSDLRIELQDG